MTIQSTAPQTAQEFFASLTFRPGTVSRKGACQYLLTGSGGGEFFLANVDGAIKGGTGKYEAPTVEIEATVQDFFDCCYGLVDFRDLLAKGRVGVSGDAFLAAEFQNRLLARPHPDITKTFVLAAARTAAQPVTNLERVSFPSEALVREAMAASRPVVVTGSAQALLNGSWSLAALAERFAESEVLVRETMMTMRDFVARLRSPVADEPVPYAFGPAMPKEICEALVAPPFFNGEWIASLWMGGEGSITALHRDFNDGFLFQAFGRKRVRLYSPDQENFLSPVPSFGRYQECMVNPENPNYEKCPEFAKSNALDAVLEEGELLAIPAGWFHHVRTLDVTASVRYEEKGYNLAYYHRTH
jgi:hypothetical protein